ncbi:putative cytochrome P450 [Halenospora varia]|nr:putative cytochrome P450 [Halenospora varia]
MLGYAVSALLAVYVTVQFLVIPIYQFFRDPKGLRRFPTLDRFAGFTNLSFMVEAHRGFRSKKLQSLHKTHPVIRTGPNSLSFGDAQAIKDIYGHNTRCVKDGQYIVTAGTHYHLADVIDRHDHGRKRKVLSSAYALKNLEEWEFKVADKTARLIKHFDLMASTPGSTVDYRAWTNFFSLDAISDIGLSHPLGFLDAGNDRCLSERLDRSVTEVNFRECLYAVARAQSGIVWSYDWYTVLVNITRAFSPYYRKLWQLSDNWDGIVLHLARERLKRYQAGEKLDDFFTSLMEDKGGKIQSLEWGEIVAEVNIMMNAGSTTTAIAMANVMFQLLKNPRNLAILREEVDSVVDADETVVSYDKVRHLPYLRACLDESMRLFPPTAHGLPRVTPDEGWLINGDFIPGGTTVSMSAFVAHRDEKIFPEPEKYKPERWLGEEVKALQPYFVAFSAGARGCIGRNISYLEQTVLLASVLRRYEFELPHPGWEPERRETMNLHLGPLPLRVWRRELSSNHE